MKQQSEIELLLTDLRADLKRGRHDYWKQHTLGEYQNAESIAQSNAVLRANIELIKFILEDK
jgi:hypothetical protein